MRDGFQVRRIDPETEEQHQAETRRIYAFNVALHIENGIKHRPNFAKALMHIHRCIAARLAWVVERDGEIVGTIGLVADTFWYSDAPLLFERWLFIRPELRDGRVLELLLAEVAAVCDATGAHAELKINNPHRRRLPRTRLERVGDALSYQPRGAWLVIAPQETDG